jgi:spermidine synthase
VGRSATVIAVEYRSGAWALRTNGLTEAEVLSPGYASSDIVNPWLAALPTLLRPETRNVLVIGFGSGIAVDTVPESVEQVDVIELEPQVIEANRALSDRRARDPLANPRVRVYTNDARGALLLTDRAWDAVISQPSHPWTSGASHLYTADFFQLVRERLSPGGVFVQWVGLRFVDEDLARTLVASLRTVFPHVHAYLPGRRTALLLVGSAEPLDIRSARRAIASAPRAMDALGLDDVEGLAASLVLNSAGTARFSAGAAISRDDRNWLQMRAPRIRDTSLVRGKKADQTFSPYDPLVPCPDELNGTLLVRRLARQGEPARADRVAASLRDPLERRLGVALAGLWSRPADARSRLRGFLEVMPESQEALAALALLERKALEAERPGTAAAFAGLAAPEAAVLESWQQERRRDWDGLAALDALLAAVPNASPLSEEALRLRVRWRIEAQEDGTEALHLADRLLARWQGARYRVLRARAATAAGRPEAALGDLEGLVTSMSRTGPALSQLVRLALREMPDEPSLGARRTALERHLVALGEGRTR